MKRSGIVAAASVGLSLLAVGCGSSGVSTAPAQGSPTATTPSAPSAQKAGVGDTINLTDSTSGKNIKVTVVKVIDPDSPANEVEQPPAGDRFESIQFRIVNSGTATYQDDPLVAITAKDAAGQNMQQMTVTSTAAGAQMPSSVSLVPGDTALGYVTFAVPSGDRIAQAQYALDAGIGTTGQWQIGNGQPAPATPAPSTSSTAPPAAPATPTPTPTPTATPTPAPTPQPAAPPATTSAASPQSVVEQYFAAITAHDYALAWALGGKNIEGGSYDAFVQGFSTTSSDDVTIVSTSGDTVTIQLDATQTDGTHKFFAGTYTVKNGVIVSGEIH